MSKYSKELWRAAACIHQRLQPHGRGLSVPTLPDSNWSSLQSIRRQLSRAQDRGFQHAGRRLLDDLVCEVESLQRDLVRLRADVCVRTGSLNLAPASDIYADLCALTSDFDCVRVDFASTTVSVETEPIRLKDVALGRFEIRLDWKSIDRSAAPYEVIALDPNPAAPNEEVTHPHVSAQKLCAGEGQAAIEAALTSGRIADFFMLVDRVLHTYTEGSAFIELNAWEGVRCNDCGTMVVGDERSSCDHCENDLCTDCVTSCGVCGSYCCSGCSRDCAGCGHGSCPACLRTCEDCDCERCDECLTNGLCETCHDELENAEDDEAANTDTTVQSDGLGQASVPA